MIVTADRAVPTSYAGTPVTVLDTLRITNPCGDDTLRSAIDATGDELREELLSVFAAHHVDAAVYVDGLWGLGWAMPTTGPARRVLAIHVVGHDTDLTPALERAEVVIAPSQTVVHRASVRGYGRAN